jgi:hypothetical protein
VQAQATRREYRGRESAAKLAAEYAAARAAGATERAAAGATGVPRSSQRYWRERAARIEASDAERAFFESPVGVAVLGRLMLALHLVILFNVGGGLRQVILVLELSQLTRFVAASVGAHHAIAKTMERELGAFADAERARLGKLMAPKEIAVCQDETFHPEICLVAIEPVSNFLLAETYVEQRDAKTWDATMAEALKELPVTVRQQTSDEGKALLSHAREQGAHHDTDLFHVQYETSRAVSLGLSRRVDAATEAVSAADAQIGRVKEQRAAWETCAHGPGRPPNFETRATKAEAGLIAANLGLDEEVKRQAAARTARRGLAADYHPVDVATGEPRTAEQVATKLQEHFDALRQIATSADLPERSLAGLAKAERQLPTLKAGVAYFHEQVDRRVADLPPALADVVKNQLLPAAYLERAANRAQRADDKDALRKTAHERRRAGLAALLAADVADPQREALFTVAAQCADLFQRTSSCVEGRNGQLALRHHHLHEISPARLKALTTIHNYFLRRPDGTTAAERFFGLRPRDLFEHLLTTMRAPPRPAARRPRAAPAATTATLH